MRDSVGNFIHMEIENPGVKHQEECGELNAYHKRLGFSFVIKPENTCTNPGLRRVAKICLNSLWGSLGNEVEWMVISFFMIIIL